MSEPNIYEADFEYDDDDPAGYRGAQAPLGKQAGGKEESVRLFELPPGEALCPYHYEYVEEWLLLIEGSLELRTPDGERPLRRGDLVCFPAGPDGAHKVRTTGSENAHFLMWSSTREPSVAVYPDSDKIGVWTGNEADKFMLRRADGDVDYYDGER